VFVTTDQNMRHQQNIAARRLGFVVLMSTAWPKIRGRTGEISRGSERVEAGDACGSAGLAERGTTER
jgi:hypothetical protein